VNGNPFLEIMRVLRQLEKHRPFPELSRPYAAEFRRSAYVVESGAGIEPEMLLDPVRWGRQPHLRRLDLIEVVAVDNAFVAGFLVEQITSGYPSLRLLWCVRAETQAADSSAADRTEYRPDLGWSVLIRNEVIASGFAGQAEAEAELAKLLAEAA
jgi:hypothetical protein